MDDESVNNDESVMDVLKTRVLDGDVKAVRQILKDNPESFKGIKSSQINRVFPMSGYRFTKRHGRTCLAKNDGVITNEEENVPKTANTITIADVRNMPMEDKITALYEFMVWLGGSKNFMNFAAE